MVYSCIKFIAGQVKVFFTQLKLFDYLLEKIATASASISCAA